MADADRSYGAPTEPVVDAGSVARMAVIGDVHGNAVALRAVLEHIRSTRVERVVCLGDVATLGPAPHEVFEMDARVWLELDPRQMAPIE